MLATQHRTKPLMPHWNVVPGPFIHSALLKINLGSRQVSTFKRKKQHPRPCLSLCVFGFFFNHYRPIQHILCHKGPVRICSVSRESQIKSIPRAGVSWYVWLPVLPFVLPSSPSIPPSTPWGSLCVAALPPPTLLTHPQSLMNHSPPLLHALQSPC